MMKKNLIPLMVCIAASLYSQIGIGTTTINNSEILSIAPKLQNETGSRGVLIPRVALTAVTDQVTISNPATFLVVYNTTNNATIKKGFYYWNSVSQEWERAYDKTAVLQLIVPAKNEMNATTSGVSQATATGGAVGYTVGLGTGEAPSGAGSKPWVALPNLSRNLNLYSATNNLTITASGMLQLNNTTAGTEDQSHSYAIGIFVDNHLYSVRTFVATGKRGMTCLTQSFDIKANIQNLSAGNHNISVYVITRNNLAGNATTLNWAKAATGCTNINDDMAQGVLSVQSQQF